MFPSTHPPPPPNRAIPNWGGWHISAAQCPVVFSRSVMIANRERAQLRISVIHVCVRVWTEREIKSSIKLDDTLIWWFLESFCLNWHNFPQLLLEANAIWFPCKIRYRQQRRWGENVSLKVTAHFLMRQMTEVRFARISLAQCELNVQWKELGDVYVSFTFCVILENC